VTRRPSDKIAAYVGVAALTLLAGLSLGRPELVAIAAPLAVLVVAGLAGARDPELDAEVRVDRHPDRTAGGAAGRPPGNGGPGRGPGGLGHRGQPGRR
jgi:hypothetical protein